MFLSFSTKYQSQVKLLASILTKARRLQNVSISKDTQHSSMFHRNTGQTTVDSEELQKFNNLSKEWWSPSGSLSLLHSMNSFRLPYIRDQIEKAHMTNEFDLDKKKDDREEADLSSKEPNSSLDLSSLIYPFKGLRILDIGCGGGILSEALARLGGDVLGADASRESIEVAKLHARKDPAIFNGPGSLTYRCTTVEQLLENETPYDIVCALEIIEHVNNPAQFLKACTGLVKPDGGHLIMSTISRTPLSYLLTILMAQDILKLVPDKTHKYEKYIKFAELQEIIKRSDIEKGGGFIITDVAGVGYNPITKKWTKIGEWVPWKLSVNYFLTARKLC
ncbi:hypothetical protein G9A89_006157 [Geosiphon pyriformis]|nr:hypothetical protein G9A89_006157 [Geosiphon pyriformis]